MIDIVKALKTRWTAEGLSTYITGGIHHSRVPERVQMPYCVFHELGSPVITKTRTLIISELQIQFEVFDKTGNAETCADLAQRVRDAFLNAENATSNPLETGTTVGIIDADVTQNIHTEAEGDEQVYRSVFEMAIKFHEPRNLIPA